MYLFDNFGFAGTSRPAPTGSVADAGVDPAPAIVAEGLRKRYGAHWAVDDVSFEVPRGWTVGLLGGNGAGKTTSIAMIMGLTTPTAGRAVVLGCDMARERERRLMLPRMNFGSPFVALPARLTVRQNLTVFGRLYGVRNLKARIAELVEDFDLGAIIDCATGKLSAGQKTRASLAKALINKPEVLLIDEPTASLDPDRADWLRRHLKAYQRTHNAAILMSSHNMPEVEQLCDFVVVLSYGRVVAMGRPKELVARYACADLDEVFICLARGDR